MTVLCDLHCVVLFLPWESLDLNIHVHTSGGLITRVSFYMYYMYSSPDFQVKMPCVELCCLYMYNVCMIWPRQLSCLGSSAGRDSA